MIWRTIADATVESTIVCISVLALILVGLPFYIILAATIAGLLGILPSDDLERVAGGMSASGDAY